MPDIARDTSPSIETRVDIYILRQGRGDLLPKLRGRKRMQVKRLLGHAGPLHLWDMVLDRTGSAGSNELWKRLLPGIPVEEGPASICAATERHPDYRLVEVAKERRLYRLGQVRGEITIARTGSLAFRTVAFESREAAPLLALLERERIGDRANQHYGILLR